MSIKFHNVVVCEDVRTENNNKHILIGVFQSNVLVGSFPARIRLAFWMQLSAPNEGTYNTEFRIREKRETLVRIKADMTIRDASQRATFALPALAVDVAEAGVLKFEFREVGKSWKLLRELPINLAPKE